MRILILFTIVLSGCISCTKLPIAKGTPSCIREEIKAIINDADSFTGQVDEYLYQNKLVYAFVPDGRVIADGSTAIKDANCVVLCHVGGFGGPSVNSCNGANFFTDAVLQRSIWKKP